jgi:Protein of unknown function (DUF3105)
MAKSTKDRDRRAVVEQLRRDQQRGERRRTIVVVAVCAVVALVIIGLAAIPLIKQNQQAAKPLAEIGASAQAAGCQPVKTQKASGNQEHKPEGTPITYPDAPPAFGPHYPVTAPFERKFYTDKDRPELPYVVHNLEHGYTLFWYDATVAKSSSQLDAVRAIAKKFEGQALTDKFIALPWTSEDGGSFPSGTHVALTHWSAGGDPTDVSKQVGVWQYCKAPSGAVVRDFTKKYPYSDSPEPQAM